MTLFIQEPCNLIVSAMCAYACHGLPIERQVWESGFRIAFPPRSDLRHTHSTPILNTAKSTSMPRLSILILVHQFICAPHQMFRMFGSQVKFQMSGA